MKTLLLIILFLSSIQVNSQTIFEYEREIDKKENYNFQEIEFENSDENIKLSGTLITPKSDFEKIIVIVAGSGKDTRYTHPKLTERLLENNIAVYRFDERGVGKSQGEYSFNVSPLKNDLRFCILQLRSMEKIKNKELGVLGHSLGGLATIGISESNPGIDFFIQMSTPVNAGESFRYRLPNENMFKDKNLSIEETQTIIDTFNYIIRTSNNLKNIKKQCAKISRELNCPDLFLSTYTKPQFIDMIKLDTELYYKNINKPLLFIVGKEDESIHVDYGVKKLKEFDNKLITIRVLDNMDHYLTLNNGEWNKTKKSEAREIDDIAANEIIEWIKNN